MSHPESTGYSFNPKPKPQRSFASTLLNYESKPNDFDSGNQTRKNDYHSNSRNPSLDDSEEITRRMDMLKRNLGLPVQKPGKDMSYSEDQAFSKYLGNNQQQSFLQGLGQSATKKDRDLSDYLNLDEDSVFQTDTKSQLRKGQSTSNVQKSMMSKEQDISPYKLSASEDMSPYREQSFERELGNYANQGISFKVYKNEDKEAKNTQLALQRENELLRKKLEEERTSQEAQNKILNAHLEEYRRTVAFDKESEDLLKQNIVFYKSQIHDFEKQILDLRSQVIAYQHNEHSTRKSVVTDQEQFRLREQSYMNEIDALKKELHVMHQQDVLNAESFGSNDVYLRKLEMNIRFLNGQIQDLTQDKSHLQTINENLEHDYKILSDKLYAEIDEKYRKEIEEKDFIIKSLKRDFELYMQMDGDSAQRASFRKTIKKKITKQPGSESARKTRGPRDSEDDHDDPYIRLNQLENENFILKEKLDMLGLQNKGPRNSARDGPNMYEAQITQRRVNTLKEALIFWKEKTEKLATTFHSSLKQLRADNEALKEALVTKVDSMEGEIDGYVKKIKKYYKKEQVKILEMVSSLEEKHHQNQAKLADARSKYKSAIHTIAPLGNITNNTKKKTKTRHDVVHFSP